MACGDVLSLEDLQTAKKHQIFEAEVITGKSGGVAGGASIDYAINQVTGQTQKTLPAVLRDAGFTPASFDFTTGGTLAATDRDKAVYDPVSKAWYTWLGALPKVVAAGTNPGGDANWRPQTDLTLRDELSASNGALVIGGAILECSTVALAQAIAGLTEGRKVRTYAYNTPVISDWIFTATLPISPTFYIPAVGGYLILMTPNYASAGITPGDYVAATAWGNRNKITKLLMDTRFSSFNVGTKSQFYVLGSVVPNRSNVNYEFEDGILILGRYDDPSVPESLARNTGGMFDLTIRENYHSSGDMTPTGVVEEVHVILNGDLGTEFNASHAELYNNNVIGFYQARNCSVSGHGRIIMSDHRGICFDGDADNCHVRMPEGSITNTKDEPIVMKCASDRFCSVDIGAIHNVAFGGPNSPTVVRCDNGYVDVKVGTFRWDGVTKPQLVSAQSCQGVHVRPGRIYGVSQGLRQAGTIFAHLDGGVFSQSDGLVNHATPVGGVNPHSTTIENVTVLDAMDHVYQGETTTTAPRLLRIINNDFALAGNALRFYKGKVGGNTPVVSFLRDNVEPPAIATRTEWNLLSNMPAAVVVSGTSITIPITKNYTSCTLNLAEGATNRRVTVDLVATYTSSLGYSVIVSPTASFVMTRTGDSLEIVLTGCTARNYVLHN